MKILTNLLNKLGNILDSAGSAIAPFIGAYDEIDNIAALYAVRRGRTDYTGPLLRLRRSSDDVQSDFGYTATGGLDIADITTWLNGASGYLTTWYDQVNGRHVVQSNPIRQPQLSLSGINGKPAVSFLGSTYLDSAAITPELAQPGLIVAVVQPGVLNNYQMFVDSIAGVGGATHRWTLYYYGTTLGMQAGTLLEGGTATVGVPSIAAGIFNGASSIRYNTPIAGYTAPIVSASGNVGTGTMNGIRLGSFTTTSAFFLGYMAEVAVLQQTAAHEAISSGMSNYYALTVPPGSTGQVIFDGNSMTASTYSSYPATVMLSLPGWSSSNFGVSNLTTQGMLSDAASQIDPLFDADYDYNILVCWEGSNDLVLGATVQEAYDHLVTYCQGRRAAGYQVVIVTLLPRTGSLSTPTYEEDRQAVNAMIRANWATFADAVADVGADSTIGDAADASNTTYYSDGTHMTTAGYAIVANIVVDSIETLTASDDMGVSSEFSVLRIIGF